MATPAEHYDALAVPTLAERASGQTFPLKKLHNSFKRSLIDRYATGAAMLVDIACGRGNDLHKWQAAGIRRVVGVDVSGAQIAEARRRAEGASGHASGPRDATFWVTSPDLAALDELDPGCADAVTCMFALNYFWETREDASRLFAQARRLLRPGGVFFGVCADGARVMEFLNPRKPLPLETDVYELVPAWSGPPAAFGSAYTLRIRDTVLDNSTPAPEYLVYWSVLREVARAHGFEPAQEFVHVDASSLPAEALRQISRINASFAFTLSE